MRTFSPSAALTCLGPSACSGRHMVIFFFHLPRCTSSSSFRCYFALRVRMGTGVGWEVRWIREQQQICHCRLAMKPSVCCMPQSLLFLWVSWGLQHWGFHILRGNISLNWLRLPPAPSLWLLVGSLLDPPGGFLVQYPFRDDLPATPFLRGPHLA